MSDGNAGIRTPFDTPPPEGTATEVAEGVLWFRLPLPMALDHVNVYALDDGDGWAIIDTGLGTRRTRDLWSHLIAGPLSAKPVTRIIATHHHPDHIGLAGWFRARGAELVTTRTAWLMARMLTLDVQPLPTMEQLAYWRSAGVPPAQLAQRAAERPFNFADCVDPLPLGFRRIAEGDTIHMGKRKWQVRTGDGHAPEHATFWSLDDNLVIGGDQLLPSITPNIGVYPTEPDADPLSEWIASCHRFQTAALESHLVLPGHKLPFLGLPTRLTQMIENHETAIARLLEHLESPRTAVECFAPLFKRKIDASSYGLALVEAVAHLNHLLSCGLATRTMEDGVNQWRRGQQ